MVGQGEITAKLKRYANSGDLPNLLFFGLSGVGKTTAALALAREIYGEEWEENLFRIDGLECDDADEASTRIKKFASTELGEYSYRLVFIDEANSLRPAEQASLGEALEQLGDRTRFIVACNHRQMLIDPIQRACEPCHFSPIDPGAMNARIREVADREGIELTEGDIQEILSGARGNLRWAITSLHERSLPDR